MLKIEGLSKSYRVFDSPRARLKYLLLPGAAPPRMHHALEDVSFELEPGQCLGIVGDNGAGKSTLLKLIAGTLTPTRGSVHREGRLTAILELGAGFHPEFSGRDNIRFAGALLGVSAAEMRAREADIVAFAEIGDAIDRAVKTYSSGMIVRLAFALVTAVEPEILVIDEALAVGDQNFQRKCIERIEAFRRRGCTILFCSHSLYHVRRLCTRALWIHRGRVRALADPEEVLLQYEAWVRERDQGAPEPGQGELAAAPEPAVAPAPTTPGARLIDVVVEGLEGDAGRLTAADLVIDLYAEMPDGERPSLGILIERVDGVGVTSAANHIDHTESVQQPDGRWRSRLRYPSIPLHTGQYMITAYLFDAAGVGVYEYWPRCRRFEVVCPTLETGLVRLAHEWS